MNVEEGILERMSSAIVNGYLSRCGSHYKTLMCHNFSHRYIPKKTIEYEIVLFKGRSKQHDRAQSI